MFYLFRRELHLAFSQSVIPALGFLLIVLLSFVLSSAGDLSSSQLVSVLWVALLLVHLLLVPFFFEEDDACGILELMVMEIKIPALIVIVKSLALWVGASVPLILMMAGAAQVFNLDGVSWAAFVLAAGVGSLGLVFLNAFGAALTCGLRSAAWLAPIIVLPLTLPIVIFGAAATRLLLSPPFMLLSGVVMLALVLAPLLAHFALRTENYA